MTDRIDIPITSTFDGTGTAAATKAVQELASAVKGTGAATAATDRAAVASQKLAQAQSQAAVASQKLATEQQRTAAAAAQAAAAEIRAEKAALQLAQAQQKAANAAQSAGGYFQQMAGAFSSGIASIVGPAAAATAAIGVLKGAADLTIAGASAQQTRASFDQLAKSAGTTGAALLTALRSASGGEIADLNLQLAANKANLLGVADSAQELATLMEIARDRAQKMGISTAQAFDNLVTGLGRGSALILDNLGIVVKESEVYDAYAASVHKTASALSDAEKKQALINAVLQQGAASIAATGGAVESNAAAFARAGAALRNIANTIGGAFADVAAPVATAFADMTDATQNTEASWGAAIAGGARLISTLQGFPPVTQAAADAQQTMADRVAAGASVVLEAIGVLDPATTAISAYAAATLQSADADDRRTQATVGSIIAQQQSTAQTLLDAQAKDVSAAQSQLLEAQIRMVADAYLALNPNIDASGVAQAVAAGKIDAAVGSYIQQVLAIQRARNELAALQSQAGMAGGVREGRAERDTPADRAAAAAAGAAAQRARSEAAAAEAQRQHIMATGGARRASTAAASGQRLATIEESTGKKLVDIDTATQNKLAALDRKAADERIAAAKRLNQAMAANAAARRADTEADDLDLIGPKTADEAARLNDRERAQAASRQREQAAAAEARATMAAGDAETAEKVYAAREEQIQKQQALDEAYYAKQRELAGDPAALEALKQQYDEATRAISDATQLQIDFAHAAAAEKTAAAQAEKDAVIAAAEAQKNEVIARAQASASGIKAASASARTAAVADLQAIGQAVKDIPETKTVTVSVQQTGGANSGASSGAAGRSDGAYAGGGAFVTSGPTNILVGDNPGGAEIVTVTPVSGKGTTRPVGGGLAMAGGGTVVVDAGDGYTTPVAGSGDGRASSGRGSGGGGGGTQNLKDAIQQQRDAIALLSDLLTLRSDMAAELQNGTPFNVEFARALAQRAAEFTGYVTQALVVESKQQAEGVTRAMATERDSIAVLKDTAELRTQLSNAAGDRAFDMELVQGLARRAREITDLVRNSLVPTSEAEVDHVGRWADAVAQSVALVKDTLSLNQSMFADYTPPSDAQLTMVVRDADRVARRMIEAANVYDTKGLEGAQKLSDAVGGTFSALKDNLLFNQALASGDFLPDPTNLAAFEQGFGQAIALAGRLGKQAAAVPAGDVAALQTITAAIAAQAETMIKLAAVPFSDLPRAAGQLGASGGSLTIYQTIQAAPGMTMQALAAEAVRQLKQQISERRS